MTVLPPGAAWLFCPADRPERFAKAAAAADVVVLDLEDGVAPAHRPTARRSLRAAADTLDATRTVVRVNAAASGDQALDLEALGGLPFETLMLAKAESRADVLALARYSVVALCETARGVMRAAEIGTAENCAGLMWGAEDLIADLGGSSSRDATGAYLAVASYARCQVLLAGGSAGRAVLDAVYLDFADLEGLRRESVDAASSGFAAKVCVHPTQVPIVRDAFTPTTAQLDWARRVVTAAQEPGAHGVFSVDGWMVDEPVLRHARRLLNTALVGAHGSNT